MHFHSGLQESSHQPAGRIVYSHAMMTATETPPASERLARQTEVVQALSQHHPQVPWLAVSGDDDARTPERVRKAPPKNGWHRLKADLPALWRPLRPAARGQPWRFA